MHLNGVIHMKLKALIIALCGISLAHASENTVLATALTHGKTAAQVAGAAALAYYGPVITEGTAWLTLHALAHITEKTSDVLERVLPFPLCNMIIDHQDVMSRDLRSEQTIKTVGSLGYITAWMCVLLPYVKTGLANVDKTAISAS